MRDVGLHPYTISVDHKRPVALCRRKDAKFDGEVVVGLGSSGFRIERQAHEDFCTHFVL